MESFGWRESTPQRQVNKFDTRTCSVCKGLAERIAHMEGNGCGMFFRRHELNLPEKPENSHKSPLNPLKWYPSQPVANRRKFIPHPKGTCHCLIPGDVLYNLSVELRSERWSRNLVKILIINSMMIWVLS